MDKLIEHANRKLVAGKIPSTGLYNGDLVSFETLKDANAFIRLHGLDTKR